MAWSYTAEYRDEYIKEALGHVGRIYLTETWTPPRSQWKFWRRPQTRELMVFQTHPKDDVADAVRQTCEALDRARQHENYRLVALP